MLNDVHQLIGIDRRTIELLFDALALTMRKCRRNVGEALQMLHVVRQTQHFTGSANVDECYVGQAGVQLDIGSGMNDQFHIGTEDISIGGAKAKADGGQVAQDGMDAIQESWIMLLDFGEENCREDGLQAFLDGKSFLFFGQNVDAFDVAPNILRILVNFHKYWCKINMSGLP